jgi:hypothetical protein
MQPQQIKSSRSAQKANPLADCLQGPRCREGNGRQPPRRIRPQYTEGALHLTRRLEIAGLERKVAQLQSTVEALMGFVNIKELQAAQRLAKLTPPNATLKLWIERSNSYPELAAGSEERPW